MITAQMDNKISALFSAERGNMIYNSAVSLIEEYGMRSLISRGVLIGLSGGADSVMLLCFLIEYRRRNFDFPLAALHVNHSIRGAEADSDERFSCELCRAAGVEYISRKVDVPKIAKEMGVGTEECARNLRYFEFTAIISGRNDISSIAVAHNSDDNMETVLLNILRGAGTRGASGIPPVRDNIFRPLLRVSKADITAALAAAKIDYVTDSTNLLSDYKRNYIRNEIAPKIREISERPEDAFARFSSNLRYDEEFFNELSDSFLDEHPLPKNTELLSLHRAVRARVLRKMASIPLSTDSVLKISSLLLENNFSYSLRGEKTFVCEYGICRIEDSAKREEYKYRCKISMGKNSISEYDSDFFLSDTPIDKSSLNVYKISIQANLSSAIIVGGLFLRPKIDGDSVFYGGITHKLKKLFNDRKIPPSLRAAIPILCDDRGVVWVPGFGVRDDGVPIDKRKNLFATLAVGNSGEFSLPRFYTGSEFRS